MRGHSWDSCKVVPSSVHVGANHGVVSTGTPSLPTGVCTSSQASMSAQKRPREDSEDGSLQGSKRALFGQQETEAPVVCAVDFGTARTGYAFAFTQKPGANARIPLRTPPAPNSCRRAIF